MSQLCGKSTVDLLNKFPHPDADIFKTVDQIPDLPLLLKALSNYSKKTSKYQQLHLRNNRSTRHINAVMYAQCLGVEEYGDSTSLSIEAHEALRASRAFADVPDLNVENLVYEMQHEIRIGFSQRQWVSRFRNRGLISNKLNILGPVTSSTESFVADDLDHVEMRL